MSGDVQTIPRSQSQNTPVSAQGAAAAIDRCREAYNNAFTRSMDQDRSAPWAKIQAGIAYRAAVPALSGHQSINDFIACVADGMLVEAITGSDGARLLYAAQVASHAFRVPPPAKSSSKS